MARSSTPDAADITARLLAIKMMIRGMTGAMPSHAAELRREACESIDELLADVSR